MNVHSKTRSCTQLNLYIGRICFDSCNTPVYVVETLSERMPGVKIDYSKVTKDSQELFKNDATTSDNVISTPMGLAIFEIQGELNLPTSAPPADAKEEFKANFAKVDELYNAVKFGRLIIDSNDTSKVTLYIGNSQRLLGKIAKLDPPLGVLRLSTKEQGNIEMIEIIRQKVIFKDRPLPIM